MLKILEIGVSSMKSRHPKLLFIRKSDSFKLVSGLALCLLDFKLCREATYYERFLPINTSLNTWSRETTEHKQI